jgi:small subunit ribosomal protein S16
MVVKYLFFLQLSSKKGHSPILVDGLLENRYPCLIVITLGAINMLSIRLSRVGTKKRPVYRIVVMPKQRDPWANSLEILGHYDPRKTPKEIVIKEDRVKYWLDNGAQATDTVWNLLVEHKVVEGEKRAKTHISKKRADKLAEKEIEAKEKAEATKTAESETVASAEVLEEDPATAPTEEEKKEESAE